MSEKLCLQWNDFKENVESSFKSLRQDIDFTDVTLACKDGQEIQSHKVILAASSPIFRSLLNKNKQNHILIYMRGVKMDDLAAILDFLYFGEANVYQHNLDSFLALAEELQLKGLKAQNTLDGKTEKEDQHMPTGKAEYIDSNERLKSSQETQVLKYKIKESPTTVALMTDFSGNIEKLGQQVSSMMEKTLKKKPNGLPLYACIVCGKEAQSDSMKKHIEANHLEGIAIPCKYCEKQFKSTRSFVMHKAKEHKDEN